MRLYKRNAKGEPQFWDISELPNGNISLKYGLVAGATVHDEEVARKCIDAIVDFYENDLHMPTHISKFVESDDRSWIDNVYKK